MAAEMGIKEDIIRYSKEIQIDEIGFSSFAKFEKDKEILENRRAEENYTEFEESDIEKRVFPEHYCEFGKSFIVVTESYGFNMEKDFPGKFSISAYGKDYHRVLKEKLEKLGDYIKENYDIDYKVGVDTNPILERAVAVRAGLGWIGKNTCFYSYKFGSFVFIGTLIISEDLSQDNDEEFISLCGDCDICIKACPTSALRPYNINLKRCIGYNTVTKKNFNENIEKYMKTYLYGCDVCQLACPKNQGIDFKIKDYFKMDYADSHPNLEELLQRSNSKYKKKYKENAIFWRGNSILKRNARLIIKNLK